MIHPPPPATPQSGLRHRLGGYREYDATPLLAHAVEAVWTHCVPLDYASVGAASHRVLPDPAVSVAFCCIRGADGTAHEPQLVVIGPKRQAKLYHYRPGSEVAALKLKLEWAERLLDLAPTDHTDSIYDLAEIHPRLASDLLDALVAARTVDQALDTLSSGILHETQRRRDYGPAASAAAFDLLRDTAGRLTIEQIASLTGTSLRQLRRLARRESGMPLKAYARVTRLVRTIAMIDGSPRGSRVQWARVAVHAGYCDQPHLIRECRAISGLAPNELVRERWAEPELDTRPATGFTPRATRAICTGSFTPTPSGPGTRHAHRSLRDGTDAMSLRE